MVGAREREVTGGGRSLHNVAKTNEHEEFPRNMWGAGEHVGGPTEHPQLIILH